MSARVLAGSALVRLREIDAGSVRCCVTSPPYWGLRDYGHESQIGREGTVDEYVANLVGVFALVHRALSDDGTAWINLGDTYVDKSLTGAPWLVALALKSAGWKLRSDVVWHKTNPYPESVKDRPTRAHEYVFMFSKCDRYYFDARAVAEQSGPVTRRKHDGVRLALPKSDIPGQSPQRARAGFGKEDGTRNVRSVWQISCAHSGEKHFAVMPAELAARCIQAGTEPGDTVLDPFGGSGTTARVAEDLGRNSIVCELNDVYARRIEERMAQRGLVP